VLGLAGGTIMSTANASVRELLRQLASTYDGRLRAISTLDTADVVHIWLVTGHRPTERDRRTHQIAGTELRQRGLLDPADPATG
jgi:hypothetical protein